MNKQDTDLAALLRTMATQIDAGTINWGQTKQQLEALAEAEHGRAVAEVDRDVQGGELERRLDVAHRACEKLATLALDLAGLHEAARGDKTAPLAVITNGIDTLQVVAESGISDTRALGKELFALWSRASTLAEHGDVLLALADRGERRDFMKAAELTDIDALLARVIGEESEAAA